MRRAVLGTLPALLLLGAAACRDGAGEAPPLVDGPGASVQKQLDDIESTLDSVESDLNDG